MLCNAFSNSEIGNALGIKIESPFLNENVVEFAKNIPANLKVKNEEW